MTITHAATKQRHSGQRLSGTAPLCFGKTLAAVALLMLGLFSSSLATADQVDDLLAGKPIQIDASEDSGTSVNDRVVVPVEEKTLAEESWETAHAVHSHANLHQADTIRAPRPVGPMATLSVVPEPSAIALAALSLVYFLLFFRRRYAL